MYLRDSSRDDPELSRPDGVRLAMDAALRARTLDDSIAETHATLSLVYMNTYDLASAEAALTRAIELDPDCAVFRENMARFHILMGRPEEALSEARLALDLDPMSPSANAELARSW